MYSTLWLELRKYQSPLLLSFIIMIGILGLRMLSFFEPFELFLLDTFFRLRPQERVDSRIVMVTLDEVDLRKLAQWPLSDRQLAQLLQNIRVQNPRVIALDIYRDFPVEPGHQELINIFSSTPNLLGIEQIGNLSIKPPLELAERNQVGLSNLPLDLDGKIRRAILSAQDGEKLHLGLGAFAALEYLKHEQIVLQEQEQERVKLGNAIFSSLSHYAGGYGYFEDQGYQIMINYRKPPQTFLRLSMADVLENNIPLGVMRDRIIYIGVTAPSLNDMFLTPYGNSGLSNSSHAAGVEIHAQITSQILSASLDGRPLLNVIPMVFEGLMMMGLTGLGTCIIIMSFHPYQPSSHFIMGKILVICVLVVGIAVIFSYNAFLMGWWVPVAASLGGFLMATVLGALWQNQLLHNFAYLDGLTKIANRRCFDRYFNDQLASNRELCMILCDIDYFKQFNDTYGHQAGDECLIKVAQALQKAIRSSDFVARYGGEEFVVVLPQTNLSVARHIAERIRQRVKALHIAHQTSTVSGVVSLSCGVTYTSNPALQTAKELLETTDHVLYEAKRRGRDRVVTTRQVFHRNFTIEDHPS